MCRRLWLVGSNSLRDCITDLVVIPIVVWYVSAQHLSHRKRTAKGERQSRSNTHAHLINDHPQSEAIGFLCRSRIWSVEFLGIEEFGAHPTKASAGSERHEGRGRAGICSNPRFYPGYGRDTEICDARLEIPDVDVRLEGRRGQTCGTTWLSKATYSFQVSVNDMKPVHVR